MIHLEPDLGYLQRIHEAALVAAGSFDVPLYITTQACEFLAVLLLCSLHGLGDLIDQTAHVLFHGAPCYGEEGVSSVHQRIPKPSYLGYSVSKGGMANLTTTLALEHARRGIRVNGIRRPPRAPGRRNDRCGGSLVAVAMDLFAALLSAALDAELVALWVGEYDPSGAIWLTVIGDEGRT